MSDYFDKTRPLNPRIVCRDGESFSVQANRFAYCTPRADEGPYTHVEVGFPTCDMGPEWEEYNDGDIFAWVPVELVQEVIDEHGGIDLARTMFAK